MFVFTVDRYRPYLSTKWSGSNDYINAVFVDVGSKTTENTQPNTVHIVKLKLTTCAFVLCVIYLSSFQSYHEENSLIVTQFPLPDTVVDFWRLVYDYRCHTIVMLGPVDKNDNVQTKLVNQLLSAVTLLQPFYLDTTVLTSA